MKLDEVLEILKEANRIGAVKDEPEGARYIQISETLTEKIIDCISETVQSIKDDNFSDTHNTYEYLLLKKE